jgi:hypothetical protein
MISKLIRRGWFAFFLLLAQAPWLGAFELPATAPKGQILLTVKGAIGVKNAPNAAALDAALLDALPQHSFTTATPWFKTPVQFSGPLLKDLLQALRAQGTTLKALALNDYKVDIPQEDAFKYDVILARRINGRVLGVRDKGPIFVIYPFESHPELKTLTYYGRCIWQLKELSVE